MTQTESRTEAQRQPPSPQSPKVGKLRPSQAVTQHGPGAIVDLPELSVIIAGIGNWFPTEADRVAEPRLERWLGVQGLYRPPVGRPGVFGGIPAFIFPEYLVCPHKKCRRLALYGDFTSHDRGEFRCNAPVHRDLTVKPTAFPARFLVACPRGHIDDFPWRDWVHKGATDCSRPLKLEDRGRTGSANDLQVECECGEKRGLGDAFKREAHAGCTGRQPWLHPSNREAGCTAEPRTILRGASNAYFPVTASALSIPPWSDPIQLELTRYREGLAKVDSKEKLKAGLEMELLNVGDMLQRWSVEDIWKALSAEADQAETNLKVREYQSFIHPELPSETGTEFEIDERDVPPTLERHADLVVAATRLREVRALRAFNRIDAVPDFGERTDVREVEVRMAPIGGRGDNWRPAVELRGEGVFIRLAENVVRDWEAREAVKAREAFLAPKFHEYWQIPGEVPFPGMRYVLLHTFAHALIREMSLECGYSSSSLQERIYCEAGDDPMSGILIYTASSDSDGSLGGLVDLALPRRLDPIVDAALRNSAFCASDPLCAGGDAGSHDRLNGAACHACLLLAETSCEFGNRLLDRNVLTSTLVHKELELFG